MALASSYDARMDTNQPRRLDAVLRNARSRIDTTDAQWLLAHALDRPRSWLYAHADEWIDADANARFEALLVRRQAGEPVAYLVGRRSFWTFDLRVTPDTLIPRPETELLVGLALEKLPEDRNLHLADLGTGSGAIALALAGERPRATVVATDTSIAALAIARHNAHDMRLGNVEFRQGDWCAALAGERFNVIVSNPPYIAASDPHLCAGDLRFEPACALASGIDGLDAIRVIVRDTPVHLSCDGWLLLEHGVDQGAAVGGLLHDGGFIDVATHCDLEQRDRVTLGRWPV